MIAIVIGSNPRLWLANANPDSAVQNSDGGTPGIAEFFLNTSTGALFICTQQGVSQAWECTTNTSIVNNLISSGVLQSNWTQASSTAQDYIKNKPNLATVATSGSYNDLSNKPIIPSGQIQSDWTQTNSSSVDFIKNKPTRTQSSASRSLNSIFQISSTRDSFVNYSVDVATTASLLGGQVGTVYLEISTSPTFASGIQELARFVNGNSVSLAIAITLNQNVTGTMSGYVPLGYYARLRTENTTGTPTFNYRSGQEILL